MKEFLKKGAQLLLGFVSAGIAKGGEFDFKCPCKGDYALLFFFVYLLGPAIFMLLLGILILRQNKDWNFGSRCYGFFFSCLVPPVVWVVMFFNGKYMECFKVPVEGSPEWKEHDNCKKTLDRDLEFYAKRAGGLGCFFLFLIIALIHDCCKKK